MAYCPHCHHEYAETVQRCLECGRRLKPGHRPPSFDLDLSDAVIPVGALVIGLVAIGMLWLQVGSRFGWFTGPLVTMAQLTPPCMILFYAVAAIAGIIIFAGWLIRVLVIKQ